jgi:hypothetical protein
MISLRRALVVTAGLALTGMVAGGLAAAFALTLFSILHGDWRAAIDPQLWAFSAGIGAVIGGVVAPLASWLFLRHVPLGRLVLETTLATTFAGGIGFALGMNPFIAAPLGFLVAATRLAVVTPRRPPAPPALPADAGKPRAP